MPYIRSTAAPPPGTAAATKSVIAPPSATLALEPLAVQCVVSVVSTRWAGEGRRRQGGRGRRAGTPAQARPRSHPTAPTSSRPLDIPRLQLLRSTRARACARARVARWAPPQTMDHLLTTYHISTPTCPLSLPCVDLITLLQCPFKSGLGRLRLPKCRHDKERPSSGGSRSNTATMTSPNPTTAPPTSTHQPHQHLAPSLPPVYTRPAPGFEPREVAQSRPLRPHPKGCKVEGGSFALGPS